MRAAAVLACVLGCGGSARPDALSNTASVREQAPCILHCQAERDTGVIDSQLVVAADGAIVDEGVTVGRITADGRVFEGDTLFATLARDGTLRLVREDATVHIAPDGTTTGDHVSAIAFHADNSVEGDLLPGRNCRYEGAPARRVDAAIALFVAFQHNFRTDIW